MVRQTYVCLKNFLNFVFSDAYYNGLKDNRYLIEENTLIGYCPPGIAKLREFITFTSFTLSCHWSLVFNLFIDIPYAYLLFLDFFYWGVEELDSLTLRKSTRGIESSLRFHLIKKVILNPRLKRETRRVVPSQPDVQLTWKIARDLGNFRRNLGFYKMLAYRISDVWFIVFVEWHSFGAVDFICNITAISF